MTVDFPERELGRGARTLVLSALVFVGRAWRSADAPIIPESGGLIPHLGSRPAPATSPQAGIGVNSYLWRATLDTSGLHAAGLR